MGNLVTPDTRAAILRRLLTSTSEEDVVSLARDYLAEWRPEELAHIPRACRPGKVRDAEDIGDLAFALTKARMDEPDDVGYVLEMEGFFAAASKRLSQLERRGNVCSTGCSESESELA